MKASRNILFISAAVLLTAVPLLVHHKKEGAEIFTGSDDQAKNVVAQMTPGYKPWIECPIKPPSGEVESLLFALQAAIGAGFIGYYFGRQRKNKDGKQAQQKI